MEPVKAAIIYYSATGTVHALARAATLPEARDGRVERMHQLFQTGPTALH